METMCGATSRVVKSYGGRWYVVNYNYSMPPAYSIAATNSALDVAYFLTTMGAARMDRRWPDVGISKDGEQKIFPN